MILKLNGADFSANNIGHVEVTTDLSEFTKKAILASGNESLTDVQKSALNSFFKLIGAGESGNTIASRMRFVFLPMLATNVSNALINYKDDTFTKSATPSASAWKMEDNGVVGVDATGTGAITMILTNPIMQNNACMLTMTSRPTTGTTGNQHFLSIRGKQNESKWLTFYRYGKNFGSSPNQWMLVESGNGHVYGYNLQSSSNGYSIYSSGIKNTPLPNVDMSDQTSQTIYTLGLSSKNIVPTAFMMLGDALTDAEMNEVINAVDNLHDIFGLA